MENRRKGVTMKSAPRVLCLFLSVGVFAVPAYADGFIDVFGGNAILSQENVNESAFSDKSNTQQATQYLDNVKMFNSPTGGFRIGGMHKWDHFSLGGAFVLEDYSAKAGVSYPAGWAEQKYPQGGDVLQPGGDLILGIPLRFFRLYGGAGLTAPMMFYDYTSYNAQSNTINPNTTGVSMALGYNLFMGARWLISDHFNMFIEDRFSSLFTPMVIKNSFYDAANGFYNASFTLDNLDANRIVVGLGYSW